MKVPDLRHADQFIRMLPNGYDTMLTMSERTPPPLQRLPWLMPQSSDEATCHIDTVPRALSKFINLAEKGAQFFVIAAVVSTIRNSDAIIVLDHGQIIKPAGIMRI